LKQVVRSVEIKRSILFCWWKTSIFIPPLSYASITQHQGKIQEITKTRVLYCVPDLKYTNKKWDVSPTKIVLLCCVNILHSTMITNYLSSSIVWKFHFLSLIYSLFPGFTSRIKFCTFHGFYRKDKSHGDQLLLINEELI
jgi:hypothetical protein